MIRPYTVLWTLVVFNFLLISSRAFAYPEFIGYGYTSCLTCHYNGNGGGPLNDYGRALWSAEIASRTFYPKSMSDEDMGAQSGFLGAKQLPYWLRPDIKFRAIEVDTNPGGSGAAPAKFYQMQTDFGLVLQDKKQRFAGILTMGRVVPPDQFQMGKWGMNHILAREYYVRAEVVKTWWVYAGLIEKVFGIRNIDHTSYQRIYQGFNVVNNDPNGIAESVGVILHKVEENWEVALNGFFGNPNDDAQYKQSGISAMGEYSLGENKRLGLSLLTSKSQLLKKQMAAIHYRQGFSKGSALIAEWGFIQDHPVASDTKTGSYALLQGLVKIERGYNILTTIERYNHDYSATTPDNWKFAFGFLVFPAPRFELRLEAVNEREFSSQAATPDSWALEAQIHVSL